jgi:hypothetical protein
MPLPVIRAEQARPGDVVLHEGDVFQYEGDGQWLQMDLVPTESGPAWQPPGELTLLVRDRNPVDPVEA